MIRYTQTYTAIHMLIDYYDEDAGDVLADGDALLEALLRVGG